MPAAPRPRAVELRPPDSGWLQWIAENRLRQCTPESMLVTMTQAGLDPVACERAIREMEHNPGFLAARKMQQIQTKLESVVANQQKLRALDPLYGHVEKRSRVPIGEFLERYVFGSRPLVLTDVARDWPALKRWSPQDLSERFGHLDVDIQANASHFLEQALEECRRRAQSQPVDEMELTRLESVVAKNRHRLPGGTPTCKL